MDNNEANFSTTSVSSTNENKERSLTPPPPEVIPQDMKCTPALMKVRKTMKEFQVHSPSDNVMSPCTAKLARKPSKNFLEKELAPQKLSFDD
uniref:Uncharacterized protein n=1 Tax=Panagrolaimus sp. JU765 TaxID=591449 RepID=A0AC34Q595_9BILA